MEKLYFVKNLFLVALMLACSSYCMAQASAFNAVGNALYDSGSCFQLTTVAGDQASAVWYNTPVNIHTGFDLKFHVFLGNFNPNSPDNLHGCGIGADGICFVLQNTNTGYYASGGGLGYENFPNQSLAIEFDTYKNGWDPVYSHIAIETNGSVEHPYGTLAGPVQMSSTSEYTADGNWHTTEIIWDPQRDSIRVLFDSVFRVGYNFDSLGGLFQGVFQGLYSNVYWGFTGATGSLCNLTEICADTLCLNGADLNLGADTAYCANFTRVLTAGVSSAVWSTGDTAAQITISQPGIYWAAVNTCSGVVADTINVRQSFVAVQPDSVHASCGPNNGSVIATPTAGLAPFVYLWNTGAVTDALSNIGPGLYTVTVTDHDGCSASTSAIIDSLAGSAVITAGKNSLCAGDSVSICAPAGFNGYQWNTGESTTCIYAYEGGEYYVTVDEGPGCKVVSNHISIAGLPQPSISISVDADTLVDYNGIAWQWYFNGVALTGDTDNTLLAEQLGLYSVAVTDSGGCLSLSNPIVIKVTGINSVHDLTGLTVYPDPVTDNLNISYSLSQSADLHIAIVDLTGRVVANVINDKQPAGNYVKRVNLATLAAGVYILNFISENSSISRRFVKMGK